MATTEAKQGLGSASRGEANRPAAIVGPRGACAYPALGELIDALLGDESGVGLFSAARRYLDDVLAVTAQSTLGTKPFTLNEAQATLALPADALADVAESALLQSLTPLIRLEGCWLAGLAAPSLAGTRPAVMLWPLYRDSLRQSATVHWDLSNALRDSAYGESVLQPVACQLALGRFVSAYLPEVLGYTLGYAVVMTSMAQRFGQLTITRRTSAFLQAGVIPGIAEAIARYLADGDREPDRIWPRCVIAAHTARRFFLRLLRSACVRAEPKALSPRTEMLQLLWRKFPYARGHHRERSLAGVRLDDWFKQPEKAGDLLDALADSPWVDRKRPLESRLVCELVAFRGPMFQVFTKEELDIVARWLCSLATAERATQQNDDFESKAPALTPVTMAKKSGSVINRNRLSPRDQFHALIDYENHPEVLDSVTRSIPDWLAKATRWPRWRGEFRAPRFMYTESAFVTRIETLYHNAVQSYQPLTGKPWLRREEYRWLLLQLAPLFLVDGCWLQRIGSLLQGEAALVPGLLNILTDEIGDGKLAENHANVFRELLRSEGLPVVDIRSVDFSHSPQIETCAFELPVYMMGLSLHPRPFLPELLGLNLAIELSGLGAFYMRLVDELRYYDFDPTIITLHISIDNLASGHAAIARDLVSMYLRQVRLRQGEAEMQRHWRRIWTGYLSITYFSRRLFRYLMPAFLRQFGGERLRLCWAWATPQRRE